MELARLIGRELAKSRTKQRAEKKEAVGRKPVLAAYANRPILLRATYQGRTIRAHVRKDGSDPRLGECLRFH
jgi:hypothetical protein